VYFSDITFSGGSGMQAGHIWRYDPATGATRIFRSPSGMSNGILFDFNGDMIVAEGSDFGGRRLTRTEMRTGRSYILAGLYNGRPFNSPDDLTIDERGRIYFTDPRYVGHEPIEQPVMGVYRLDSDHSVHLIAANVWKPNGIAVSPDQKTLYVISIGDYNLNIASAPPPVRSASMSAVHAYDLLPDGAVRYRKQLVDFPATRWGDGMKVDVEGNLYVGVTSTVPEQNGVYVFSPEGQQLAMLHTPEGAVNLGFGRGAASNMLYVACQHGLYRIKLLKSGYQPMPH
jgi:gluconolactonase